MSLSNIQNSPTVTFAPIRLNPKEGEFFLNNQANIHQLRGGGGSRLKNSADIIATSLWFASVGFCIYKTGMFRPKSKEHIIDKAKKIHDKFEKLERLSSIESKSSATPQIHNTNSIHKFCATAMFRFGEKVEKTKAKMGDELYNNLINSVGKVFIMPLIICANPFDKNKTDKNEKISVIIREPLSVFATFTLQGAFDKIFNVYMPKVISNNILENDKIQTKTKNKQRLSAQDFDDIKYNDKEIKRLFIELTEILPEGGGLKGVISEKQAKDLLTLKPTESECYESYIKNFERLINPTAYSKENYKLLKGRFDKVANVVGNCQLAKINPKIAMNIVTVVILSRIFLNVIYGKSVKLLNLNKTNEEVKKCK